MDIQALRALAVVSVVLYHLWPNRLSGGYVGVDVFFVISGFLITSHLLAHPPRHFIDLLQFWSRRIRRLLPASLLVLLVTLIATRLVAPDTLWANTARYVRAAALYGVNWRMAGDSVDYLAANNAPTPVQHFWSLSVEEQFYLGWPILIALLVLVARRHAWHAVAIGLGAVTIASFWYSIHETATNPGAAYFITPTRIWELGVAGCLAAALARTQFSPDATPRWHLPTPARTALAWAGLAAIAWTLFAFTDATPFPSWRAALPVLGAAAVIAAAVRPGPGSPLPIMSWRPIQWLGDISYSIYLWHWPLLVLLPYKSGGQLGRLDKLTVIATTLVLSTLTKRYVEDRFRGAAWGRPLVKPYALGTAAMAIVVAISQLQTTEVHHRTSVAASELTAKLAGGDTCFGAGILDPTHGCPADSEAGVVLPAPATASSDGAFLWKPEGESDDCMSSLPDYPLVVCHTPVAKPTRTIAMVGSSHAAQWGPAIAPVAKSQGWRIDTYFAHYCPGLLTPDADAHMKGCAGWAAKVVDAIIKERPDLVIISTSTLPSYEKTAGLPAATAASDIEGFTRVFRKLTGAGLHVFVVHDIPGSGVAHAPQNPVACLSAHEDSPDVCAGDRKNWEPDDPAVKAAQQLGDPRITAVNLNDLFCPDGRCPAVIGGAVVYSDSTHMTATFSRTLAPYVAPYLLRALS